MSIFKGAGVAIVTPFHEDGSVNYEAFGSRLSARLREKPTLSSYAVPQAKRPRSPMRSIWM